MKYNTFFASLILAIFVCFPLRLLANEILVDNCEICKEHGMGMVCEFEELAKFGNLFVNSLDNLATPNEVDAYVECQLQHLTLIEENASEWKSDYKEKYVHYINEAATSFGVPPQLLQCSFLKEGKFNRNAKESIIYKWEDGDVAKDDDGNRIRLPGAKGMCQFMDETASHVDTILVRAQRNLHIEEPSTRTGKKDRDLWRRWEQTFNGLISNGLYADYGTDIPTRFSTTGALRPQNCIAAAALYYNDMVTQISAHLNVDDIGDVLHEAIDGSDRDATKNLMIVLAAAYNAGPGAIGRILKRLETPVTLQAMANQVKEYAPRETKRYITSLENCLSPNNFDPPSGWYQPDGMKPPTCEEQKAKAISGAYGTSGEFHHNDNWPNGSPRIPNSEEKFP